MQFSQILLAQAQPTGYKSDVSVIVSHKWRTRVSAWLLAVCLASALAVSGVHAHEHDADTDHASLECVACMVVSDLEGADVPASISIPDAGPKLTFLPQASHALTLSNNVAVKARGPPERL